MRVTLKAIAKAAHVSVATASRALNQTGPVSAEVALQVRAAALKLKATAARKVPRIQVICFLLANRPMLHPFHAHVLMGAQSLAAERGSHILFYPSHYGSDLAPSDIRLPLLLESRGMVDGVIVGGMNTPNVLELFRTTGMPFAVLGNNVLGQWKPELYDVVWMDDAAGAAELTKHLQRLGHRRIAFLESRWYSSARMRQGFRSAMEEAGLEPVVVESDSQDERDSGFLAGKRLISQPDAPSAILCYSDTAAHGVFEAARTSGIRIPDDLSVAGFGNRPEATAMVPALTTAWGYPDQVGRRLAEMLLHRLANPSAPAQSVLLPTRLIPRESCAAAPVATIASTPPP
ncbi:MAG: LacI family DNA-binding transcriptional regulator [Opitutaceae bacterium]|nr:LacI family DNA-binding transcriptional regulator [Opitutaceae bacterium]